MKKLSSKPLNLIFAALTLLLVTLACGFPNNPGLSDAEVDAAVKKTLQAGEAESAAAGVVATPRPPSSAADANGGAHRTPPPPATPTGQPNLAAPAGDSTAPLITNVNTSATQVYYESGCGATTVTFYAEVTDPSGVAQVWINYQYLGHAAGVGGAQWYQANLYTGGGNRYQATIDTASDGFGELQGVEGTLQYQILAMDAAGNIRTEPDGSVYGVQVSPCGGQAQPGGSGSNIVISNLMLYPQTDVFYGPCSNGEETRFNVQATIDPLDEIASAILYYTYSSLNGMWGPYTTQMYQLGIGDYAGDIDAGAEAPRLLGTDNGAIDFYIEVTDQNGSTTGTNLLSVALNYCGGGVLGPPPQGAVEPDIRNFSGPASANAGDSILLEWDVWDACKVFLDGVEVNHTDSSSYGVPANEGNTTYSHVLTAWGSTCDNTNEKTARVNIAITGANAGNNNPASTVRFYNNSSHPVVELIIDGSEVILAESQSIPVGGFLDVNVSGGSHNYQAGVGFGSGGQKIAIYPLPSGSFSSQDGSTTLGDPTLTQMLTNYGQGGYYSGEFWDANNNFNCAAFDFYANGGFDFYVNQGLNDSGYYSLISRNPGSYSVTFKVENAAGTEWFEGTYYYTGALAGTIQMQNGPATWPWIEYVLNGGC